ncbi:MAG: ABC transporter substrate-binding protein, partial [Chloroflexota bacterium]
MKIPRAFALGFLALTLAACGGGAAAPASSSGSASASPAAPSASASASAASPAPASSAAASAPASSSAPAAASAAAPAAAGKTITIGIDIPFHPLYDYLEANVNTYFKNKPYTVKMKVLDATTQVPAFGKGELDVMTTVPSFMPRVKDQYGIDTVYVFPLARWTPGPQLLVPANSPYTTLASLKGKKVAVPPLKTRFGAEEAAILAATGENIRQYFKLDETEEAAQQLALGRVDAAFIEAPTTYPLLKDGKFKAIYSVQDAFKKAFNDPAVMNGGFIARASLVKDNPQFIRDLTAAMQDIWSKYQKDEASIDTVASKVSGVPVAQLKVV